MTTKREREMAAAIADAEAEEEDDAPAEAYFRPAPPTVPSQVYSVRIPVEHIERLRRVASEVGEKPTALIRRWVIERLAGVETQHVQIVQVVMNRESDVSGSLKESASLMREIDRLMDENASARRMMA